MSNKKQNNVWYHGTPDVRELQQDGGFTQRHIEIEYVEDIDKWNSLQEPLNKARENNNQEEYTSLIKQRGDLRNKKAHICNRCILCSKNLRRPPKSI